MKLVLGEGNENTIFEEIVTFQPHRLNAAYPTTEFSSESCRHLSGNHVVPDEDKVDPLVCCDAQRSLDALQICCDVWKRGRLCPAVAADTQTHTGTL